MARNGKRINNLLFCLVQVWQSKSNFLSMFTQAWVVTVHDRGMINMLKVYIYSHVF
jgi:hypothetical protein